MTSENLEFTSVLDKLKSEWRQKGWLESDLMRYKMEGEDEEYELDDEGKPKLDSDGNKVPKDPGAKDTKVTMTQERLSAIMAREKREGKRSGSREFAKELGYDDPDALKADLAKFQEIKKTSTDETERAKQEAERERNSAKAEATTVKRERLETKIERQLFKLKVKDERVEKAVRLIDLDLDAEDDDIKDAVEKFQEDYPEFFSGEGEETGGEKPAHKTPGAKPPAPSGKKGGDAPKPADTARSMLERRHGSRLQTKS